jgi:hypothetical protein
VSVRSDSEQDTVGPQDGGVQLSRDMALSFLNAIEDQLENIVLVSIAALAYQETLSEETRSFIADNLFGVIRDEADRSTAINELRKLLETLPSGSEAQPAGNKAPHLNS